MRFNPVITLLTDFGDRDTYVGTMKGVILGIKNDARIVDLCHSVNPQNIVEGAYLLKTAYRHFPPGTVHVVVVDPGVGTDRKAIAFSAGQWLFVGPDNGVFSYVLKNESVGKAVDISGTDHYVGRVGDTFHGRDIFAPAAALIATGAKLENLGPLVTDLVCLDEVEPAVDGDKVTGQVIHIDRFGNCITNIEKSRAWFPVSVYVGGASFSSISHTYADVPEGRLQVLYGSSGHIEVAVRGGSAAEELNIKTGDKVVVHTA